MCLVSESMACHGGEELKANWVLDAGNLSGRWSICCLNPVWQTHRLSQEVQYKEHERSI